MPTPGFGLCKKFDERDIGERMQQVSRWDGLCWFLIHGSLISNA